MVDKFIIKEGRRYYYYETYDSYDEAKKEALFMKKKNKCKYFILQVEQGLWFPEMKCRLYLNKVLKLWN